MFVFFCLCQVCLKRFVLFLRVSGMLDKKCFFCVCQVCLKRIFFLRVSGMLEKKWVFGVCQVCLKRNGFFACVRYA